MSLVDAQSIICYYDWTLTFLLIEFKIKRKNLATNSWKSYLETNTADDNNKIYPILIGSFKNFWVFSVCVPQYVLLSPPPPQLQSTCLCKVNHYVKIWHVRLVGANNMHPLSWWGAQTEKIDFSFLSRSYHSQAANSSASVFEKKRNERLIATKNIFIHLNCTKSKKPKVSKKEMKI